MIDHQQARTPKERQKLKLLLQMLLCWCKQIASGMEHLENLSVKETFFHPFCIDKIDCFLILLNFKF